MSIRIERKGTGPREKRCRLWQSKGAESEECGWEIFPKMRRVAQVVSVSTSISDKKHPERWVRKEF